MPGGRRTPRGPLVLLVVVALLTSCGAEPAVDQPPGGPTVASYTSPAGQSVEVVHATADTLALVEWAFGRIDAGGLTEPEVERIDFAASAPGCRDATGWAVSGGGTPEIAVCLTDDRICRQVDGVVLTLPWAELGVEQAADTIAWGLLGGTIEILGRPLPPCEQLHDGFVVLTGTTPTTDCGHIDGGP